MKFLIIPSAKLMVDNVTNLGKMPPILVPINEKGIVLDYMLKTYSSGIDDIKIIGFEQIEKIIDILDIYTNYDLKIVKLASLESLGKTVLEGLNSIREEEMQDNEVIINFADTIVDDNISKIKGDSFFFSEDYISNMWTFFEEKNGELINIIDKKQSKERNSTISKLFVGVFKITHIKAFVECLNNAISSEESMDPFYKALKDYSIKYPMKAIKTDDWYDIGHSDKYVSSKLAIKAREFNHIIIDKARGILKKTSDDKDKFSGEILWYLKLPTDIEYARPRIFSYSTNYENLYIEMEYYSYYTVHELFLYGELSYKNWMDIFSRIKFIYNDFSRYSVKDSEIKSALKDIYLDKTLKRLSQLQDNANFKDFFDKPFLINNISYRPLNDIKKILEQVIPNKLYDVDKFNIIHGDLCFSNILIDRDYSFIKVIDPRGKFGKYDIYGDSRYELAKIMHSVDGKYDFIIKDLFKLECVDNHINFAIKEENRGFNIYDCFLECFKEEIGDCLDKFELIEALLFLSMIPLHGESLKHQYAMLATGINILDHLVEIRI